MCAAQGNKDGGHGDRRPGLAGLPITPGIRSEKGALVIRHSTAELIGTPMPVPECHASTIACTADGLVVAFFGGTREGHEDVGIWLTRKEGGAWSCPCEVARGTAGDGERFPCWNPVLFQVPGGPLLLFYKVGPNCADWWGMLMASSDGGRTWGQPRRLPDGIWGPVKNKPVQLSFGSLLCPTSGEATGWQVFLQVTDDIGATWQTIGPLNDAREIAAIQPTILLHACGRMQMLCRTRQGFIAESWSADGGRSWAAMRLTELPNPNSGIDAVALRDGRVLLVYNHTGSIPGQWGGRRTPLNAAVSCDGLMWRAALVLEDGEGEYSYPAVIEAPCGEIHVTYTWQRRNIKHVVIDPSQLEGIPMSHGRCPEELTSGRNATRQAAHEQQSSPQ